MSRTFVAVALTAVVACRGHHDGGATIDLAATETVTAGSYKMSNADTAPAVSREQAVEQARGAGLLGSEAALTGPADVSSGFESQNVYGAGRKIIRSGRVELLVPTYDNARRELDALIAASHGYIASTAIHHRQGTQSDATLVVRIPANGMRAFVPQLAKLGEVISESTDAADVTTDYTDTAARLLSAKTLEKRLLALAADGHGKVEDVLAVERELARVRGDVESLEARIRGWDDHVAMASLTLELSTKRPELAAPESPGLGSRIDTAFHDSLDSLRDAGAWIAVNGIAVLPWLVLAIPGLLVLRRLTRRIRLPWAIARRRGAAAPAAAETAVAPAVADASATDCAPAVVPPGEPD